MSGNLQGFQIAPVQSTDPLQTLAQMSQLRTQGLQQQEANLQLKQQQMQMDSNKAMMQAFVDGGGDPDKTQTLVNRDPSILASDKIGLQTHMLDLATKRSALTEQQRKIQDDENDHWAGLLDGAQNQDDVNSALARGLQEGYKPPAGMVDAQGNMTQFTDPQHIKAYSNGLLSLSKLDAAKLSQQQVATSAAQASEANTRNAIAQRTQAIAEIQGAADPATGMPALTDYTAIKQRYPQAGLPDVLTPGALKLLTRSTVAAKEQPEYDIKTAQADAMKAWRTGDPSQIDQMVDKIAPVSDPMNATTKQYLHGLVNSGGTMEQFQQGIKDLFDHRKQIATETDPTVLAARTQQAVNTARAVAPIKIYTSAGEAAAKADAAGLTPDDYNRAGEQYTRTGVMPALGRDSITRARIVQAGNQWARDNGLSPSDVVTMQAAYAGDKDSLKKFQSQRDQIVSFEQTAGKNLDLFLNAASKIPDTGVPWLNTPLRNLNANVVGSENMAAVNAARQVANNEIAKVTSGGGLSGVLSDSARHEVESYNPASATFAQTKAVAQVLKQDMANRHGSMDATLSDIKSRIGGGGAQGGGGGQQGGPPPLQYVRTSTGANNHKIGQTADGKWHDVQTGAVIQ